MPEVSPFATLADWRPILAEMEKEMSSIIRGAYADHPSLNRAMDLALIKCENRRFNGQGSKSKPSSEQFKQQQNR